MREGVFDDVVNRHLAGRSIRSIEAAAGLPDSSIRNMRRGRGVPSPAAIASLAQALDVPADVLTRALLTDRGYDLGPVDDSDVRDIASLARSMTKATRRVLLRVAEVMREPRSQD